jgi:type II secretory pathway component PulF
MAIDPLDTSVTAALRAWRTQHSAGVALSVALGLCAPLCDTTETRQCFQDACARAGGSADIEGIFAALRPLFTEAERGVLLAGWKSGRIEEVMDAVAGQREQWALARSKVRSGMLLPAAILLMASFIAPLPGFFAEGGSGLGYLISAFTPLLIAYLAWRFIGNLALARARRTPADTARMERLDEIVLGLPIAGEMDRQRNQAEFAGTLGLLISAGMPITTALDICASAMPNSVYGREVARCAAAVREGGVPLSSVIQAGPLWPPRFIAAVVVGEQSGTLDAALARLASQAREEYTRAVERLAEWLPRLVYGLVALFVLFNIVKLLVMLSGFYQIPV